MEKIELECACGVIGSFIGRLDSETVQHSIASFRRDHSGAGCLIAPPTPPPAPESTKDD